MLRWCKLIFTETRLKGAYIIELKPIYDERGFFVRTWCQKKFADRGLNTSFVQCNLSFNKKKGIVRGMHYQAPPFQETKLVKCIRDAIYDVIIDLRPNSETFKQWISVILSEKNHKILYVPEGFAHGFQTLEDQTEVWYQMSEFYHSEYAEGVRYDDPAFGITWPIMDGVIISKKIKPTGTLKYEASPCYRCKWMDWSSCHKDINGEKL